MSDKISHKEAMNLEENTDQKIANIFNRHFSNTVENLITQLNKSSLVRNIEFSKIKDLVQLSI